MCYFLLILDNLPQQLLMFVVILSNWSFRWKMGRLRKMGHLCDGRSGKLARLDEMDSLGKMGHSLKMEATRHEMFHVDGGILVWWVMARLILTVRT